VYDNVNKKIVGYTRLLNQYQAKLLGRFYSQDEFNLDQVLALPGRFLEIGRTCVDPDYRGGAVFIDAVVGIGAICPGRRV